MVKKENQIMADKLTSEQRSWNMRQIKSKDTQIEIAVRRWLFARGFRFRKNDQRYPGKPDIVLPKYNTVIFINGCFWHRHENCKLATTPKTRTEFWLEKFERNIENDKSHRQQLESMGWKVITLWECELKKDKFEDTMSRLESLLRDCNKQDKGAECEDEK